ncbi:carbohydrate kinase family protein [Marinilabilia rubra]|uniref:Carbohydrate kinase n=1 Tax=Marinilabilia rubra TaxID=2162893 RepID=A0A2U2B9R8_9BACT|nr:carbohydrate kinase [Marinilabilia rubra]PWD99819.1 carbohydrate kinase [Marinilabilia rubra]
MKKAVVGIGEILWDLLPEGKQLGGAPANFAWHAKQLGANGAVISAIGQDKLGDEILELINSKGLTNGISILEKPTGTVGVELVNGIPDYTIFEDVAWDRIELNKTAIEVLDHADAICFGSLAQRSEVSRQTIRKALEATPIGCEKVFDINLRQNYYSKEIIEASLQQATVFKLNDEELIELRKMFQLEGDDLKVCGELMGKFNLKLLALTGGEEGSTLMTISEVSHLETPKVEVADTIGAGDSFTAAITMGLLEGLPLPEIHRRAVNLSAFVCTQNGAMPSLKEGVLEKIIE